MNTRTNSGFRSPPLSSSNPTPTPSPPQTHLGLKRPPLPSKPQIRPPPRIRSDENINAHYHAGAPSPPQQSLSANSGAAASADSSRRSSNTSSSSSSESPSIFTLSPAQQTQSHSARDNVISVQRPRTHSYEPHTERSRLLPSSAPSSPQPPPAVSPQQQLRDKRAAIEHLTHHTHNGLKHPSPSPSPSPSESPAEPPSPDLTDDASSSSRASVTRAFTKFFYRIRRFFSRKQTLIVVYSILLLLSSLGNSIFFKKMINHMPNYIYFLNQFTSFIFAPLFFIAVYYEYFFTSFITQEMMNFSKLKFFWMGVFDSISGVLVLFGAVHTSGSSQALFANAVIPITMILSFIILGERYTVGQYVGAAIIMVGVSAVLLLPADSHADTSDDNDGGGSNTVDTSDVIFFNILFLISVIPGALSSIYKELAFAKLDIDANYLQAWVALFQTLIGFFLIPLNTLSFLGTQAVPWNELGSAMTDGAYCLFGYNLITTHCIGPTDSTTHHGHHTMSNDDSSLLPCDNCSGAWIPLTLYVIFNLLFNVFTVLLIKHGSSTLMFIIMTLRLPLVQFAFSWSVINDPPDPFGWMSALSLACILTGLIVYRWPSGDEVSEHKKGVIMPLLERHNAVIPSQHHEQVIRLKKSEHALRTQYFSALGVIASPYTPNRSRGNTPRQSPLMGHSARETSPLISSSRAVTTHKSGYSSEV